MDSSLLTQEVLRSRLPLSQTPMLPHSWPCSLAFLSLYSHPLYPTSQFMCVCVSERARGGWGRVRMFWVFAQVIEFNSVRTPLFQFQHTQMMLPSENVASCCLRGKNINHVLNQNPLFVQAIQQKTWFYTFLGHKSNQQICPCTQKKRFLCLYWNTQDALWNIYRSCWDIMDHRVLHKLVVFMNVQVHVVIKAKGKWGKNLT